MAFSFGEVGKGGAHASQAPRFVRHELPCRLTVVVHTYLQHSLITHHARLCGAGVRNIHDMHPCSLFVRNHFGAICFSIEANGSITRKGYRSAVVLGVEDGDEFVGHRFRLGGILAPPLAKFSQFTLHCLSPLYNPPVSTHLLARVCTVGGRLLRILHPACPLSQRFWSAFPPVSPPLGEPSAPYHSDRRL